MRYRMLRLLTIATSVLAEGALPDAKGASVQPMAHLFADEERVLADNFPAVIHQIVGKPLNSQFEILADWVLPSAPRPTFRMSSAFMPAEATIAEGESRPTVRGIQSPVFALIDSARQTRQLASLRQKIEALPEPVNPQQLRSKKALLFLTCSASGDEQAATDAIVELTKLVPERERNAIGSWWPETLALAYALEHHPGDPAVFELATTIYESQVRQGRSSGNTCWDVFVATCFAELRSQQNAPRSTELTNIDFPQGLSFAYWDAASTITAETRGLGLPSAVWQSSASSMDKLRGHNNDVVYLPIPMLGDFEIQCDVTSFDYREIAMAYAGQYASHHWTRSGVEVGTIRDFEILPLNQPITNPDSWLSSRITVRDGICTHFLNGHQVLQRSLPPERFPWVGIRTYRLSHGSVRNLTVRGTPLVPESVSMSFNPRLPGWSAYYDEPVADSTDSNAWNLATVAGQPPEIQHPQKAALVGSLCESVLSYHRPMAEDGVISYEFYYEPNHIHVHPALGQLAFLLHPGGVHSHKITNGKWEQLSRETQPGEAVDTVAQKRNEKEDIPLQPNEWNRLQFAMQGNLVRLFLNGELVFQQQVDASDCRQFGLFHYSDQTSVRVRNMQWKGDWSKSADLAGVLKADRPDTKMIEQAASAIPQSYQQRLKSLDDHFTEFIQRGGPVKADIDGLVTEATSLNRRQHRTDAPLLLEVGGDFDLRASFQDFQYKNVGDAGLELLAILPNDGQKVRIDRHRWDNQEHKLRTRISAITDDGREQQREVDHWSANQASSGTFRMVRIGTALHYMFAEGDSSVYRLLATDVVGRGSVPVSGICLTAFADKGGGASGTWTSIAVRAERVSGVGIPNLSAIREQLNTQRDALTKSVLHDFSRQPPDSDAFTRWTDLRPWNSASKGLLLKAVGSDRWESSGLSTAGSVVGDFDIRVEFDQLNLAKPSAGHQTTLGMEVQSASQPETMINALLGVNSAGTIEAEGYSRIRMADGSQWYSGTERSIVQSATALRIARRGNRYFKMVRAAGEPHDRIISISDHSNAFLNRVQVSLHTGGTGRESNVRLKSLQIWSAGQ